MLYLNARILAGSRAVSLDYIAYKYGIQTKLIKIKRRAAITDM